MIKKCANHRYTYFGGLLIDHLKEESVSPDGDRKKLTQKQRKYLRKMC